MTSVYGVTYVGAREQIKRRLEEKGVITDERMLFAAACYSAKVRKSNIIHANNFFFPSCMFVLCYEHLSSGDTSSPWRDI